MYRPAGTGVRYNTGYTGDSLFTIYNSFLALPVALYTFLFFAFRHTSTQAPTGSIYFYSGHAHTLAYIHVLFRLEDQNGKIYNSIFLFFYFFIFYLHKLTRVGI